MKTPLRVMWSKDASEAFHSSAAASASYCASVPCLHILNKSFILNLNLIDLTDLTMSPSPGVCPALEPRMCGEGLAKQTESVWRGERLSGRMSHMPEVKPVSSGEWGQLSSSGPRIVFTHAAGVSYLGVFVRGGAVLCRAGQGGVEGTPAALTERTSVLEWAFGGIGWGGSGS